MKNRRYIPDITHTLNPVAVRAIDLVRWRPRPDWPGNYWIATVAGVGDVCVCRRERGATEFIGWVDGDDSVEVYESCRVALDGMALIAVALHDRAAHV